MTTRSRVWFAVFIGLVLVCGGLAGVVLDRLWLLRHPPVFAGAAGPGGALVSPRGGPRPLAIDRQVTLLTRQLSLTPDQQSALRDVLERWNARAGELQAEARVQFTSEQQALLADVEALLTPEQAEGFRQGRALIMRSGAPLLRGGERGGAGGPGRGPGGRGRE